MKREDYDLWFFRQDRRKAVCVDGADPKRFEFSNSTQRFMRKAKVRIRRRERRAAVIEVEDAS